MGQNLLKCTVVRINQKQTMDRCALCARVRTSFQSMCICIVPMLPRFGIRVITNIGAITNIGSRVSTKQVYVRSRTYNTRGDSALTYSLTQSFTRACPTEEVVSRCKSRGQNPTARSSQ